MLRKELLKPLVEEVNSKPCQFCGKNHSVWISPLSVAFLEVSEDSCALWVKHLHDRAKTVLSQ